MPGADGAAVVLTGALVGWPDVRSVSRPFGRLTIGRGGVRIDWPLPRLFDIVGGVARDTIRRADVDSLVLQERGNHWDPLRETQWWVMMTDRRFSRMGFITRDGNCVHAACATFGYPVRRVAGWGSPWKRL